MSEHYEVIVGALGGRSVIAKLGNQRKPRAYLVQATSDDRIIVSEGYGSKGSIGCFDMQGRGVMTFEGAHFPHLRLARPFAFPPEFVRTCIDVAHPLDSETDTGRGVIVANTVRVI